MTKKFKLPRKAKKRYKQACLDWCKKPKQYKKFTKIYMNENDYGYYLQTGEPLPF